jgi:hypothetical protein
MEALEQIFQEAMARETLPTSLSSREIRELLGRDFSRRSVFSARTTSGEYLKILKDVIAAVAKGEMDKPLARLTLKRALQALGYTPATGFPDDPAGTVPPAMEGSLRDLASDRRLNLIIDTQKTLLANWAYREKAMDPASRDMFPAFELIRAIQTREPRDWPARWVMAGGPVIVDPNTGAPRLVALIDDPIWAKLGDSDLFDDALDVDVPPFAFNSGRRWRLVSKAECEALGVEVETQDGKTQDSRLEIRRPRTPPPAVVDTSRLDQSDYERFLAISERMDRRREKLKYKSLLDTP